MENEAKEEKEILEEFNRLVAEYRDRCLWFIREDYLPNDKEDMKRLLKYIERYGDRDAFVRARKLERWL